MARLSVGTAVLLVAHLGLYLAGNTDGRRWLYLIVTLAVWLVFGLTVRWFVRRESATALARPVLAVTVVTAVLQLPGLFFAPVSSTDLNRYVWDGRVRLSGVNPYRYEPLDDRLAALRDPLLFPRLGPGERSGWTTQPLPTNRPALLDRARNDPRTVISRPRMPTPYPPLAQAYFTGVSAVTPWSWGVKGFQVAGALLAVATGALLAAELRRKAPQPPPRPGLGLVPHGDPRGRQRRASRRPRGAPRRARLRRGRPARLRRARGGRPRRGRRRQAHAARPAARVHPLAPGGVVAVGRRPARPRAGCVGARRPRDLVRPARARRRRPRRRIDPGATSSRRTARTARRCSPSSCPGRSRARSPSGSAWPSRAGPSSGVRAAPVAVPPSTIPPWRRSTCSRPCSSRRHRCWRGTRCRSWRSPPSPAGPSSSLSRSPATSPTAGTPTTPRPRSGTRGYALATMAVYLVALRRLDRRSGRVAAAEPG